MLIWNRSKLHDIIHVLWAHHPSGPSPGLFAKFKHADNKIFCFSRVIQPLSKTRKGQIPLSKAPTAAPPPPPLPHGNPKPWAACNSFWINLFQVWAEWAHSALAEVTTLTPPPPAPEALCCSHPSLLLCTFHQLRVWLTDFHFTDQHYLEIKK